jgi:hypothetical protein
MKVAAQQRFWPLRPTLTARRLELGCWLAAGALAVAIALSASPPAGPPAQAVGAISAPQAAEAIFRRRCIDGILASDLGDTEEHVVRLINQQCMIRRRTVARPVGFACVRPFVAPSTPVAKRVAGCLGG